MLCYLLKLWKKKSSSYQEVTMCNEHILRMHWYCACVYLFRRCSTDGPCPNLNRLHVHIDLVLSNTNSLSVQSLRRASVILNLSELPCPGGFPATFRLSVVPRPWSTIVSITVRLFLHRFPVEDTMLDEDINTVKCSWMINWHYLTMRREETLWLLTGVNLTLNDFTSPGSRRRLYTKGLVKPSTNPVLVFIRDVCQTNREPVRVKQLPHAASGPEECDYFNQLIL